MSELVKSGKQRPEAQEGGAESVDVLIAALGSTDGPVRQHARLSLVAIGKPAVPALIEALTSHNWHSRWEAAKALSAIGDPVAAPALIVALEEEKRVGIRWVAANALIAMGRDSLIPLSRALTHRSASIWLREGAHHILRALADSGKYDEVRPVLDALDHPEPSLEAPLAARDLLDKLLASGNHHVDRRMP